MCLSWGTNMATHVILGGTGSLGNALARLLLATMPEQDKVRVLARGEHRLNGMRRRLPDDRLSFLVGDVRDIERLRLALRGATYVYHLAALKHVHTCEYDVVEAVKTNVDGTANVVRACVDCDVERAVLVSTDKAVDPTTAYGATKHLAERIFIHGNAYGGAQGPKLMCVRYGNVVASQGSVIELWRRQSTEGAPLTMTDPSITRFWWTVQDAAQFVYKAMQYGNAGDVLVPLMPSCTLGELADAVAPNARRIRVDGYETEKRHEVLLAAHETSRATYVNAFDAVRVSYLRPPCNERPWGAGRLCSADYLDMDGVKQALGGLG